MHNMTTRWVCISTTMLLWDLSTYHMQCRKDAKGQIQRKRSRKITSTCEWCRHGALFVDVTFIVKLDQLLFASSVDREFSGAKPYFLCCSCKFMRQLEYPTGLTHGRNTMGQWHNTALVFGQQVIVLSICEVTWISSLTPRPQAVIVRCQASNVIQSLSSHS